jgi:hypothetical protein
MPGKGKGRAGKQPRGQSNLERINAARAKLLTQRAAGGAAESAAAGGAAGSAHMDTTPAPLRPSREDIPPGVAPAAGGAPPAGAAAGKRRAVPYAAYGGSESQKPFGTMKDTTEDVGTLLLDKAKIMAALKESIGKIDGSIEKDVLMAVKTLIHAIILGTTISNTNWGKISKGIVEASATMGPGIKTLATTVMENMGSGTLDGLVEFQKFLLSGSWSSGIFIGLLASAIATNQEILKVILDSYTGAIGETKESVQKSIDTIVKRLQPGYLKAKIWGIMKGANNLLGGSMLQPLVDGLNKKIVADKKINRDVLETNIETIKSQVKDIFTKDARDRKTEKMAEAVGLGGGAPKPPLDRSKSVGGRRTRRRRRGKKSRKHTKKQAKRKRKNSRSKKRRQRRSKLGKRRTKRR